MKSTRLRSSACVLLLLGTGLFGQSSKLSPELVALMNNPGASQQHVNVIVQMNPPSLLQTLAGLLAGLPGVTNLLYGIIAAASHSLAVSSLGSLANNSNVSYVSLDRPIGGNFGMATDFFHQAGGAPNAGGYRPNPGGGGG